MKKLAVFLALVLTLCACAPSTPTPDPDTTTSFTSEGYTLAIPNEYVDLLVVDTTARPDSFFQVNEKASMDAVREMFPGDDTVGGGFLFAIGYADRAKFNEMMAHGMTGVEVFARDDQDHYFLYYHPTDVQLMRNGEYTDADWEQWMELSEWAGQMKQSFIDTNPGLTPYERTYRDVDSALAQIAYLKADAQLIQKDGDCVYTSDHTQSLPFAEQLLDDVLFLTYLEGDLNPEGNYITLSAPGPIPYASFDFFIDEGQQQFIRQNYHFDDNEVEPVYFVAHKDGAEFPAGKIVADWMASLS